MSRPSVLITGGAGYIGSHAARAFLAAGYGVVVLDNLSTGFRGLVPEGATLIEGDAGDRALVSGLLRDQGIGAVIHFAGSIVVPESIADPLKYYRNNTGVSRDLIEACVAAGVERFIFSSTAAVYGEPDQVPIAESAPPQPISPYGTSKLMTEWVLRDVAATGALKYVALRYFNVAGADPAGESGQASRDATHLIKVACELATGKRAGMTIFGSDYDTADGTCVRDYIHVSDLAAAHVAALRHLEGRGGSLVLNCGYGHGYSVRQVLDALERLLGRALPIEQGERRPGDPAALVADVSAIHRQLDWAPQHDDLDTILRTALAWEEKLPGLKLA